MRRATLLANRAQDTDRCASHICASCTELAIKLIDVYSIYAKIATVTSATETNLAYGKANNKKEQVWY